MAPGATLVTQSTSPFFTRTVFWSIRDTLAAAGFDPLPYQVTVPSFSVWGFNLARRDGPVPDQLKVGAETRFLDDQVLAASRVFGKDMRPTGSEVVNSIFEPKLYGLYASAVND